MPAFVASTILSIMTRGKTTKERVVTAWKWIDQAKIKQQTYQSTNKQNQNIPLSLTFVSSQSSENYDVRLDTRQAGFCRPPIHLLKHTKTNQLMWLDSYIGLIFFEKNLSCPALGTLLKCLPVRHLQCSPVPQKKKQRWLVVAQLPS